MKHITKEEALKLLNHGCPEPVVSQFNKPFWWFLPHAVGILWIQYPERMVITNLIWILFGLSYIYLGNAWSILGFALTLFGLIAFYFHTYRKFYKALKRFTYRIDENGISASLKNDDGIFLRCISNSFSLVKDIWLTKNYIFIKMEKTADLGVICLFAKEKERILGNIIAYMQLERKAKPDEIPLRYNNDEFEALKQFITERFGKPTNVLRDSMETTQPIDIVTIPPTKTRNYWTICTLGASVYRVKNKELYYISKEGQEQIDNNRLQENSITEYFEYVMYLPPDWNLTTEGLEKENNYWVIRVLNGVGHDTFSDFQFQLGDTVSFNTSEEEVSFDPSTDFFNILMLCPLPDIPNETYANIGGRTIQFHQVMPITTEELEFLGRNSPADFMKKYLNLDIIKLDEEPIGVKEKQYAEALISHFERHIKGANVVTMYPLEK